MIYHDFTIKNSYQELNSSRNGDANHGAIEVNTYDMTDQQTLVPIKPTISATTTGSLVLRLVFASKKT